MPTFHQQKHTAYRELGRAGLDGYLTNATKQVSESCLLANYTLLSDGTQALVGLCSGKPP